MTDDATIEAIVARHAPGVGFHIDIAADVVTVTTDQPGQVIGRRGTVAAAIRSEIEQHMGRSMHLRIIEDPRDGGSGVRQPRPRPDPVPDGEAAFLEAFAEEVDRWDIDDVVDSLHERRSEP